MNLDEVEFVPTAKVRSPGEVNPAGGERSRSLVSVLRSDSFRLELDERTGYVYARLLRNRGRSVVYSPAIVASVIASEQPAAKKGQTL